MCDISVNKHVKINLTFMEMRKKGDFENPKVPDCYFSTKSVPNYCGFSYSVVCWGLITSTNRGYPVPFVDANLISPL